jgi:hypothetical protein
MAKDACISAFFVHFSGLIRWRRVVSKFDDNLDTVWLLLRSRRIKSRANYSAACGVFPEISL